MDFNFKKIRESLGMTQREISKSIGVSINTYRMWEWGANLPSFENMIKVKEFLKRLNMNEDDARG